MNAPTFDSHSPTCPICQRTDAIKPRKMLSGLLTCQYCRERLVVSWSGHYVRDPFRRRETPDSHRLRQQSHPLARIWRDFKFSPPPLFLITASSALFLGLLLLMQGGVVQSDVSPPTARPATEIER